MWEEHAGRCHALPGAGVALADPTGVGRTREHGAGGEDTRGHGFPTPLLRERVFPPVYILVSLSAGFSVSLSWAMSW